MDPDEGRYAEIAREILLFKDWLIPHLNLLPYSGKAAPWSIGLPP